MIKKINIILSLTIMSFSLLQAQETLTSNSLTQKILTTENINTTEISSAPSDLTVTQTTPINNKLTRLYCGALGAAQLTTAGLMVGGIGYGAYTLSCAVVVMSSWLFTPVGTTACIGYVAEAQGVPVVMPLVYGLATQAPQIPTQAVIQAGCVFAKAEGLKIAGYTGTLGTPAFKATQYVGSFINSIFRNGVSNLQKAFA